MDKFKKVKFCIGPMSKNIVDAIINYVNDTNIKMILIPSRRQIEFDGGYVNNWTTKEFSEYVRSKTKNIFLERDHGGPGQGSTMDNGIRSLEEDCKYFDIIHIDPWKFYKNYYGGLNSTVELIKYCYEKNKNLYFEIATEEAIKKFTVDTLKKLTSDLDERLDKELYDRIIYLVIQSGTALREGKNIGTYENTRLNNMVNMAKKRNFLTKEHNGDWLSDEQVKDKFSTNLDAINIAPEFGMIETKVILDKLRKDNNQERIQKFYKLCYESKKWVKWVSKDFKPEENKEKLIEICGHYVFAKKEFLEIKNTYNNIDEEIKRTIYDRLLHIHSLIKSPV